MSLEKYPKKYVKVNGEEIGYHMVEADTNGNPRCVVHFLSLGIKSEDYGKIPSITKYNGKWFGGGVVFQAHNVKEDLGWQIQTVKDYYSKK